MSGDLSLKDTKNEWHGSTTSYAIGFVASLVLTCVSFLLVITEVISSYSLIYTIVTLAFIQAIFQLIFFLHLGQEAKPRWETMSFKFMVMVLLIIVIGTFWIMFDLDERVMSYMNQTSSKM